VLLPAAHPAIAKGAAHGRTTRSAAPCCLGCARLVAPANTIALPRYAQQAVDQQFARWVMLHVQSNPLPICSRPRVLIKGKRT
jgi:Phage major capsid protein E